MNIINLVRTGQEYKGLDNQGCQNADRHFIQSQGRDNVSKYERVCESVFHLVIPGTWLAHWTLSRLSMPTYGAVGCEEELARSGRGGRGWERDGETRGECHCGETRCPNGEGLGRGGSVGHEVTSPLKQERTWNRGGWRMAEHHRQVAESCGHGLHVSAGRFAGGCCVLE